MQLLGLSKKSVEKGVFSTLFLSQGTPRDKGIANSLGQIMLKMNACH